MSLTRNFVPLSVIRSVALISTLLLVATAAGAALPPTPGTGTYDLIENIEYANISGTSLKLDLRIPNDVHGPFPVIVYLHSGAWIEGDRTGGPAIRQARRGYAVASIDYRLAPDWIYPAQLEDCKAAVRWLRANAQRYNLDPRRIGVFGSSAGGHLAALLGTTGGVDELEGPELGNAGYSSRVKAVVDYFGPTDLLKLQDQKLPCIPLDANEPYMPPSLLIGCPIQDCPDKTEKANPIRYVDREDPPFLIVHGMLDCLVPWQQSQMLYDALHAAGVDAKLKLIPLGQHGDSPFDDHDIQQMVSDFLDTRLRGAVLSRPRSISRR